MKIDVLTLFPAMFGGVLSQSMIGIARKKGILDITVRNIRDHAEGRHRTVDDRPYGGGPGMILKVEPVIRAVERTQAERGGEGHVILLTPRGRRFDQAAARRLARLDHLVLVCGHYEGFDERIRIGLGPEEISIGDYVLSGGEIAAMVLIDAVTRLLPGVLGSGESLAEESFNEGALLEYPQYTRPAEFRGMRVPEILLSGHHERIEEWRRRRALERSRARRTEARDDEKT